MSEFKGELHPKIIGVTRVSRRVIFLVFAAFAGVLLLVMYGLNTRQARAAGPYAAASPSSAADFSTPDPPNLADGSVPTFYRRVSSNLQALTRGTGWPRVRSTVLHKSVDQVMPHTLSVQGPPHQSGADSMDDALNLAMQGRMQSGQLAFDQVSQVAAVQPALRPQAAATQRPQDSPLLIESENTPAPAPVIIAPRGSPSSAPLTGTSLKVPFEQVKELGTAASEAYHDTQYVPSRRFAPRTPFELIAGSVIPAELVTAIDSELPGVIVGQVRSDVFDSRSGKYVLIPRGSRLIGGYENHILYGQSRVVVAWQRLIFPDTSSIDLYTQPGADNDGHAGLSGRVDNHTGRVVGALLLSSVLSALSGAQATISSTNPSNGSIVINSAGQQVAQAGSTWVQREASVPPTIHIPKGYPFVVVVDRDIAFSQPYTPVR
jgi:type IV secretory pathway VirB10-like protein